MSEQKTPDKQFNQDSQPRTPADPLDAQYKTIGIPAVAAAGAVKKPKDKKPSEQWN